jgi:hypothetical protein
VEKAKPVTGASRLEDLAHGDCFSDTIIISMGTSACLCLRVKAWRRFGEHQAPIWGGLTPLGDYKEPLAERFEGGAVRIFCERKLSSRAGLHERALICYGSARRSLP